MNSRARPSASGLTALELAVLQAVEACGAPSGGAYAETTEVLERVDDVTGVGPRYTNKIVADLLAPWVRHLPILDGEGNFGSMGGDEGADARYTQLRLSPLSELALASERGEVGPLPLDLIEGSLYRGGGLPPFDPTLTVRALLAGAEPGAPRTPTGTIAAAAAMGPFRRHGRWLQRYQLSSVIRTGRNARELVLTEPAFLVPLDLIAANLRHRIEQSRRQSERTAAWLDHVTPSVVPPETVPLRDVVDETSGLRGTWIVLYLEKGVDIVDAADWARSVWPVTTHVDCASYEEIYDRFGAWRDLDKSGVRALGELIDAIDE